MDAVVSAPAKRHPWLDQLVAAPAVEVRALVEGTASIHPFGRAEPSDAAATLLFGLQQDDPAVEAFDRGVLETLRQYRTETARAEGARRDRIALAAIDLMTVVQRLTPKDTVIDLHRRFAYWNAWAETLVVDRGLDLRREYWRVLALTQDLAGEAGFEPRRLLPFWLDICGEAGTRGYYDDSYLTVGLLGLRSLPLGDEGGNEEAALHGLARWADAQRPSKARFLREWHVLESAFPRDPTFWTHLVARVLASAEAEIGRQTNNVRTTFPATAWWREDVEAVEGEHLEPRSAELEPPPREQLGALLADIRAKKPFSAIETRLRIFMRRHEVYANRTGDTFYLVRTACNIGNQLIDHGGDVPERRAASARGFARLALRFEPANIYAWALWRKALAAEGCLEAAELVGWETIRRFPEDPQWRNQLALLLSEQLNQSQAADELLRETIRLFPDDRKNNVVAHTQLANIVGRDPVRLKEAIAILTEALAIEPDNRIAKNMRDRFGNGKASTPPQPVQNESPARVASADQAADLPADIATYGRMRRALFRVRVAAPEFRDAAKREVEAILREDENLAYARYVAAAADVTEAKADDTVFAAAFLAAARDGSAAALRPFLERARGVDAVIVDLASASHGDEESAARLTAWMAEPANDFSPRDQALRAIAAHTGKPVPDDLVGDMLAASLGAGPIDWKMAA